MLTLLLACTPPTAAPADPAPLTPPIAERRPFTLEAHGSEREDPYYWLRDREDPATVPYLEAENAFYEASVSHTAALRERTDHS